MIYTFLSLALFAASLAGHVFFCRRTPRPGLHAKAYIIIAILFLLVYSLAAWKLSMLLDPQSILGLPFEITSGFIFLLLIPVYLSFYVLTQLMSPSKKILLSLAQGPLSYKEILGFIEHEHFIDTRLSDLCTSGCVNIQDGRYALSQSGKKIAAALNLMQAVFGREAGG